MNDQIDPSRKEEEEQMSPLDSKRINNGRKVTVTKESVKRYKVIVQYVQVTEEEAKIKKATIERIMRKHFSK